MIELLAVSVIAGVIAGISPCILPVLPVVLAASSVGTEDTAADPVPTTAAEPVARPTAADPVPATAADPAARPTAGPPGRPAPTWRRPVLIVAGLVLSFSIVVLAGSELISLFHLPSTSLRDTGLVLLVVLGISLIVPPLGDLIERPFARIGGRQPDPSRGGFVVGLALGLVFAPCAGPVLAAITVVGATRQVGISAVFVTIAFGIGAAIPLLAVALAGRGVAQRVKALRTQAPVVRRIAGVVLIGMAVAIGFNTLNGLQKDVPGYTSVLQSHLEGGQNIRNDLGELTGHKSNTALAECKPELTTLANCGPAPNFTEITQWLNTPGDRPLTMEGLRGKVVLVDFWTYSCINCERTLPHVEAWYSRYKADGFVVVGVHTPEFAFEHDVSNVRSQSAALGVHYPIAIDNNYGTWNAYENEYWPAEYLISPAGQIVHESFGEGGYSTTELLIRQLLRTAHPSLKLPPPTSVPNLTPTGELSPETYVGYQEQSYLTPTESLTRNAFATYHDPSRVPLGEYAFQGRWDEHGQYAAAGPGAELELGFLANDVYLVLGGSGTIRATVGHETQVIHVSGTPRLYTMFRSSKETDGVLTLHCSPGIDAYDFTFG